MKRRAVLAALAAVLSTGGCVTVNRGGDEGTTRIDADGKIDVRIDGESVDLSAERFQAEHADDDSLAFHLHEGDDRWYMEGEKRVTFAEAIDLLPHFAYDNVDGHHVVTVDGTAYDERDGADIEFVVDGGSVDPTAYELRDGDELLVEIETP
jgi:hypothetical protein